VILNPDLTKIAQLAVAQHLTDTIMVGPQPAQIKNLHLEKMDLIQLWEAAIPIQKLRIRFKTPVAFSIKGADYTFRIPTPQKIFGTLLRHWNRLAENTPYVVPKEFWEWIETHVFVTSCEIATRSAPMGKATNFVGATGWLTMIIDTPDPLFARIIHGLAKFGEIVGVGEGRSAGFGRYQIQFFEPRTGEKPNPNAE
jgi:CRISPR-associated endoribonuclease Cas6